MAEPESHAIDRRGLPDFIIIGAPKCATSALHLILAHHPEVFIPDLEVYFFDVDEITVHPEFFMHAGGFTLHDFERDLPTYLDWYRSLFEGAKPGQRLGEDSTTYLSSRHAAERIGRILPDVRLVAMLRDPVSRAYSNYWHNVRMARSSRSFEHTLRYAPTSLLTRGFYAEQLARYQRFIDSGQLRVFFFEDFVADRRGTVEAICRHVGLETMPPDEALDLNPNPSRTPISIPFRLAMNPLLRPLFEGSRNIPGLPGYVRPEPRDPARKGAKVKLATRAESLLPVRKPPPMKAETRRFLEGLFARENAGLADLIGEDVAARWPYMKA